MDIQRRILVFGKSVMLGDLAANLRAWPFLSVVERESAHTLEELRPDVILVDAEQAAPEQFYKLIALCPTILSVDPETHQLNILSSPRQADLAEMARVVGILSFALSQPA